MRIKACILGVLLVAALGTAGDCIGCYTRIGCSLQSFERNYQALGAQQASLSSMDRVILSVILARAEAAQTRTDK